MAEHGLTVGGRYGWRAGSGACVVFVPVDIVDCASLCVCVCVYTVRFVNARRLQSLLCSVF